MTENKKASIRSFCWAKAIRVIPVFESGTWYIACENKRANKTTVYRKIPLAETKVLKLTDKMENRIFKVYETIYNKLTKEGN